MRATLAAEWKGKTNGGFISEQFLLTKKQSKAKAGSKDIRKEGKEGTQPLTIAKKRELCFHRGQDLGERGREGVPSNACQFLTGGPLGLLGLAADRLLGAWSKHLVEHVVGTAVGHKARQACQAQAARDQHCHTQGGQQEQGSERSKATLAYENSARCLLAVANTTSFITRGNT